MQKFASQLETFDFEPETLKNAIHTFAEENAVGMGKIMMPLRLALVGELKGPDVPDILAVLGKDESVARINSALETLK